MFLLKISVVLIFYFTNCCFGRSFVVDYDKNAFLKDGEIFRYISGDIHYFRIPRMYWKDRLMKMKAAGLNTVQTYIAWNVHEGVRGKFNFEQDADIESFVKLVDSLGLLLIVRPGPYICAEWDLGGFPAWLLQNDSMVLRTSDEAYLSAVTSWMNVLLPKLKKYLYSNGGPIIAVQVENEYGSYYPCDHKYMSYLEGLFRKNFGEDVVLFTVDPVSLSSRIGCGTLPSLLTTVDFGPDKDPNVAFRILRKYQSNGPLVNTEFYVGWIDNWGLPFQRKNSTLVAKALDKLLAMNASVNIYMFEGGTNFGYTNGATFELLYLPVLTSYDYDAPLSEAGDPTQKYFAIRDVISKYLPSPPGPVPPALPKHEYGRVYLKKVMTIWDALEILTSTTPVSSKYPDTAEKIGQFYGFTIYRTELRLKSGSKILRIPGVRDSATIFLNQVKQGILDRNGWGEITLTYNENDTLDIFVENQGHINFLLLKDPKGIVKNVTLDSNILTDWKIYPVRLGSGDVQQIMNTTIPVDNFEDISSMIVTFYVGDIPSMPDGIQPRDSFLDMNLWTKGQVFINGFNAGRYWPKKGPQRTLYIPASALYSNQTNKVMLFELNNSPCFEQENCYVEFIKTPILS